MSDETIAPTLYRTGRGDRTIPLAIGVFLALSTLGLPVASGPFLWPWGWGAATLCLVGAGLAFGRWTEALVTVRWLEDLGGLEWGGRGRRRVAWADLTRVEVRPSAARTWLWAGNRRFRLSHRVVGAEGLLDRIRERRPDLFPPPGARLVFRVSWAPSLFQAGLALGTGAAAALLAPWSPVLGLGLGLAAASILARILWSIPRKFVVEKGSLTVRYLVRTKTWRRPRAIREDGYTGGGAVFFRMQFEYPGARVVLDEGTLLDPLRPVASAAVRLLQADQTS